MKKTFLLITIVLFASSFIFADGIKLEFMGSYFTPANTAFKEIYGKGLMCGVETSVNVWKGLDMWLGVKCFNKLGELSFTKERTRLSIFPVEVGLRYVLPLSKHIFVYGGIGINYCKFKESNVIGKVNATGIGYGERIGTYLNMAGKFFIDIFLHYFSCKMKPADFHIDIGGLEAGIGLGYEF